MEKPKIEHPKIFISYAWTSDAYVNKVASFAKTLMEIGVDVLFDKFEMKPGNELNDFMERSVKDDSVTNVLLLLNKAYQEKADKREGGVGKETQIISEQLYNNVNQTKIIPVIFEKGQNGEVYKPAYLGSTYYIDLTDETKYDSEFKLLVKSLYGETIYRKPEIGKTPNWVTETIVLEPKTNIAFSSFKNQSNIEINNQNFILFLDEIKNKILQYETDNIENSTNETFYKGFLQKYKDLSIIRNEYLELVKNNVYVSDPEKKIASFFEDTLNSIDRLKNNNVDLLYILLHELFIYTIAYFIKTKKYEKVGYFLGKTYYINNSRDNLSSFSAFYHSRHDYLDNAVNIRDNKRYYTGTGNFWIENLNVDFCSQDEFTLADILCFNYLLFGENTDLYSHWFPITYIYGYSRFHDVNVLKPFAGKLRISEFFVEAIKIFNMKDSSEFIEQFKIIEKKYKNGEFREFRYQEAFDSAPVLCQYVKSDELGKYR